MENCIFKKSLCYTAKQLCEQHHQCQTRGTNTRYILLCESLNHVKSKGTTKTKERSFLESAKFHQRCGAQSRPILQTTERGTTLEYEADFSCICSDPG